MKQFILLTLMTVTTIITSAQITMSRPSANYEAANWRTWLLDRPDQITIGPPPNASGSKKELQLIKQTMGKLDEKKLTKIKYWDAGAPSYRWNQILPSLAAQKFEVMLRMPSAWMNIAIYDAT